jgi:membrane protease YdiL (CAAX protease family)
VPWDFAAVFIVLGVILPWHARSRMTRLMARPTVTPAERLRLYASTITWQWAIAAVVGWRAWARALNAQALGLRTEAHAQTVEITVALSLALVAGQLAGLRHAARLPEDKRGKLQALAASVLPHTRTERLAFLALAVTAGVCEEFVYRGFVCAALQSEWPHSWVWNVLWSSLLFALAHLYQGRRGMSATFVAGTLFGTSRVITGSLAPAVLGHIVVDTVAGLAGPRLLLRRYTLHKLHI